MKLNNKKQFIPLLLILFIILFFFISLPSFENFQNEKNIKYYIGITTIPMRLPYIHNTLNSILSQNVSQQPENIFVFIPPKMERKNIPYDLSKIPKDKIKDEHNKIIYVTDVQDKGPITKFYKLLDLVKKEPNSYLILIDDDVIYPDNRIQDILNAISSSPETALGFSGRTYLKRPDGKEGLIFKTDAKTPLDVDILETFDLVAYPRNSFPNTSQEFLSWTETLPKEASFVDDIVLSYWCKKNNVSRKICEKKGGTRFYSQVDKIPEEVQKVELLRENVGGRNLKMYKAMWNS